MQPVKLSISAFSLTAGLLWGFGVFFVTWWIMLFDGATKATGFLGRIYRGYEVSPRGSFIGLLWALADGAVGGALFAWMYNWITTNQERLAYVPADQHRAEPVTASRRRAW